MHLRANIIVVLLGMCFGLLQGCGSDTNIFRYTTPQRQVETFQNLLALGQAAYDRGEHNLAIEYAERAYDLNPDSERAATLYGFVNLALAGGDPYELARNLSATSDSDSDDATDALGPVKEVLGFSGAELNAMGQFDTTDPNLPVIVPYCAEEARLTAERLQQINAAIAAICPFSGPLVRVFGDARHECGDRLKGRTPTFQAMFLWAFTHLTEALAFQTVLTYNTTGGDKSNLEQRVEAFSNGDVTDPVALIEGIEALRATVESVLPSSGTCKVEFPTTQFQATVFNLLAVNAAFAQIPGLPDSMRNSIERVMAKVNEFQEQSAQSDALRGDFTDKMAGDLKTQIDDFTGGTAVDEDQAEQLCANFDSIAGAGSEPPAICNTGS